MNSATDHKLQINQQISKMKLQNFTISQSIVNYSLQALFQNIWEGIATNYILKKIPLTVRQQTFWTHQSFVQFGAFEPQMLKNINQQKDPKPADIDNLGPGNIVSELNNKNATKRLSTYQKSQENATYFAAKSTKQFLNKKEQNKSKKSDKSLFSKLQEDLSKQKVIFNEDKLRSEYFLQEKINKDQKQKIKNKEIIEADSKKANEKILKNLKKYTFGYQGQLQNVTATLTSNNKIKKMNLNLSANKKIPKQFPEPIIENVNPKKDKGSTNNTNIANPDKKIQNVFSKDAPKSIIQLFTQDRNIVQGVKLTQTTGKQHVVKQSQKNTLKNIKKYRLTQFKEFSRDKRFAQHKRLAVNFDKEELLANKNNSNFMSQKSLVLQQKNERVIDGYSALPPLTSFRSKGNKKSEVSLNYSRTTSKKDNSRILIENGQLFSDNFKKNHKSATISFD